jgi:hypothetical protein
MHQKPCPVPLGFFGLIWSLCVVYLDIQDIPADKDSRPYPLPYGCFLDAIRVFFDANWVAGRF